MAETELELQLQVWKDLAVSKQLLMMAATDALKLDPNCSQEELKVALNAAIKRAIEADVEISNSQERAKMAVAMVEMKLAESRKSQALAEAARDEALANQQKLEEQLTDERGAAAQELGDLKKRLAEKERALRAINTALADTPENVLKKLKALKKQKLDESEARKRAEDATAATRKEKQKLEQTIKEMQAAQENAVQLAGLYRELHTLCGTLHDQLKPLVEDPSGLPALPTLNDALLEGIEKAGAPEERKAGGKGKR